MSLQDSIFDIQAALKGTPEEEDFERVYTRFCLLEKEHGDMVRMLSTLRDALAILKA